MDRKILVVDDEQAICDVLKRAFEAAGYTVYCAETAEWAKEVVKREDIQVMFLDLKLPGMNGVELCKKIRHDRPSAVILAMTGYSSLFGPEDCREAGFDNYFEKPVELKVLLKAAKDAFEELERQKQ